MSNRCTCSGVRAILLNHTGALMAGAKIRYGCSDGADLRPSVLAFATNWRASKTRKYLGSRGLCRCVDRKPSMRLQHRRPEESSTLGAGRARSCLENKAASNDVLSGAAPKGVADVRLQSDNETVLFGA
jgi:hypothetical protein